MAAKPKKAAERYKEIRNAKAFHHYFVGDRYECGLVLTGTEVKSIREGRAQIADAFVRIEKGRAYLFNAHINEYAFGNFNNHNPTRLRALLLHRREINKLMGALQMGGCTLVPLRMYFKQALVKLEIAVCKGKKLYDKREALKEKEAKQEADRLKRAVY